MQAFGTNHAQAGIGVAQHQNGVGLNLNHKLVALGNYIAHCLAQVAADSLHINVGVFQLQVLEKDAVKVVVVVLAGVRQQAVEVLPAFVDYGRKADDFRTGAYDD